jgi:hypothetical protein
MEPTELTGAAGDGGRPEKTTSRTLGAKTFWLIVLPGAAGAILIAVMPGLGTETRNALIFILVPVVVTPLLGSQAGLNRGCLVIGSVLGGEIAAALYATGQYGRFYEWLIAVEFVALLMAPRTQRMLGMIRIPGIPRGWKRSTSILKEMPTRARIARILGIASGIAVFIIVLVPVAAVLGLLPAAICRVIVRTPRPPEP